MEHQEQRSEALAKGFINKVLKDQKTLTKRLVVRHTAYTKSMPPDESSNTSFEATPGPLKVSLPALLFFFPFLHLLTSCGLIWDQITATE